MGGVRLAVQTAAAYRITRLLQQDELPPLPALRRKLNEVAASNDPSTTKGKIKDELLYMFECPWCLGFWVSVAVLAADAVAPRLWRPLATALALSAAVGLARTKLD